MIKHCHKLVLRQDSHDLIVFDQDKVKTVLVAAEYTRKKLHQALDLHVAFYRELEKYVSLAGIERNPEESLLDELDLGYR